MATFRHKPVKIKYLNNIDTLDETHCKYISDFEKNRKDLPLKEQKLESFIKQLKIYDEKKKKDFTSEDIKRKAQIKISIDKLTEEINDIKNNVSEIEYYSKTNKILMDYYDLLEMYNRIFPR